MNKLAEELNERLSGSIASDLLSEFGKRFFFPRGIAAQSAEATSTAKRYNATIGMAFEDGAPMMLPSLAAQFQSLTSREAVSYAPNGGDAELRARWSGQIRQKNPSLGDTPIGTPTVVAGLTNGLAQLADLFVETGDHVIIPNQFWGNYRLIFEERKLAEVRTFPFYTDVGTFDVAGFVSALEVSRDRGKAIVILNFPNNPTGYSPSEDEATGIVEAIAAEAARGTKLLVVTDDAYFGLFYEPETHKQSLFAQLASIHPNVLAAKVDGPTKEDFVWGFRIGFVTFAGAAMTDDQLQALERKLLGAIRSSISNSSRPAQSLLLKTMAADQYESEKKRYFDVLSARYAIVREIVDGKPTDLLAPLPFNSGYFMSFRVVSNQAELLRTRLLTERHIGTIAIQDSYLRVAYSGIDDIDIRPLYDEVYSMAASL